MIKWIGKQNQMTGLEEKLQMAKKHFAAAATAALLCLSCAACGQEQDATVQVNQDVDSVESFTLSADGNAGETEVSGCVYLLDGGTQATVAAQLAIGVEDWGGVSFSFPPEWRVTGVLSSYPAEDGALPSDDTALWSTGGDGQAWTSRVEVGHSLTQTPTGGGSGMVVIQLSRADETAGPFSMLVAAGSELRDGVPVSGIADLVVELSA